MRYNVNLRPETRLERHVAKWLREEAQEREGNIQGVLEDLFHGGCASGIVGHLIYYSDTLPFFNRYKADINALLKERMDSTGMTIGELFGDRWDDQDPLIMDTNNRNMLAWFGFEEAARDMADRAGVEL